MYAFFGIGTETILLATQSLSFLEKNKELQRETVAPLSLAIKDSLARRGFDIEVELINHDLLNTASTVWAIEIFVSNDREIGVVFKKNGKVKSQKNFIGGIGFENLAEEIVSQLLDNKK